jgi:SAM-dependent methyltransferase
MNMDEVYWGEAIAEQAHTRAAAAFSAVSAIYDAETEPNPMVAWVREQTANRLRAAFAPGDLVLELGCGTGVEAIALARAGIRVLATDVAPGMLARTRAKVRAAGLQERVQVRLLPAASVGEVLDDFAPGAFAGAYSSFGALNCEPDLGAVAAGLAPLIRPGGRVHISAINRFHPFEALWYAAHGDLRRATRRWGGHAEGTVSPALPHRVPTFYHTPHAFARHFTPHFRVRQCRALLLFLPPPYLAHLADRYPRFFHLATRCESRVAPWPGLRALGDHFWLELERAC